MNVLFFILAIWVIGVPWGVYAFRRFSSRSSRRITEDVDSSTSIVEFVGGMRFSRLREYGNGSATMPLIRLPLFDWGVRLGPSSRALNWIVPTIEIRYSEINAVDLIQGPLFKSSGVRLLALEANVAVLFWTTNQSQVLESLSHQRVSVNRNLIQLKNRSWTKP
jgi:hypothetical protein